MNYQRAPRKDRARRQLLDDLERLDAAHVAYRAALQAQAAIRACPSTWSPDIDGATRCQLLDGHEGQHRHRPRGAAAAVVTW